jgi:hypothetical protein
MADAAPAVQGPGRAGDVQNGQQQRGGGNQLFATIARFALMWWLMSYFKGNQQAAPTPAGAAAPLYRKGDMLDMYVYVSEQSYLQRESAKLVCTQTAVGLATTPERSVTYNYTPSEVSALLMAPKHPCWMLHVLISCLWAAYCRL